MEKFFVWCLIVLLPAILFGALVSLASPVIGTVVGAVVLAFGIDMTRPCPERGESRYG